MTGYLDHIVAAGRYEGLRLQPRGRSRFEGAPAPVALGDQDSGPWDPDGPVPLGVEASTTAKGVREGRAGRRAGRGPAPAEDHGSVGRASTPARSVARPVAPASFPAAGLTGDPVPQRSTVEGLADVPSAFARSVTSTAARNGVPKVVPSSAGRPSLPGRLSSAMGPDTRPQLGLADRDGVGGPPTDGRAMDSATPRTTHAVASTGSVPYSDQDLRGGAPLEEPWVVPGPGARAGRRKDDVLDEVLDGLPDVAPSVPGTRATGLRPQEMRGTVAPQDVLRSDGRSATFPFERFTGPQASAERSGAARPNGPVEVPAPVVHVTIGSVEVHRSEPAVPPAEAPDPGPQPMSLGDYLRGREGGGR